jgi:hypothetical protein
MSPEPRLAHNAAMHEFLLYHRHSPHDCAATFAAWNGFRSPLRGTSTRSTCSFGAHEIWWNVTAVDDREALANLPRYVAGRTVAIRVAPIEVP